MAFVGAMHGGDLGQLRDMMRDRAEKDLFWCSQIVFNMTYLNSEYFHRVLARVLESTSPGTEKKAIFAPRGGGKSEFARAKKAREILTELENGISPHKFFSAYDEKTAFKNALDSLKKAAKSQLAGTIWPNAQNLLRKVEMRFNSKGEAMWHKHIPNSKADPHIKVAGINSGLTSGHYNGGYADDMIHEVSARSPAECARALDWIKALPNVLDNPISTPVDMTGTFYRAGDTYVQFVEDEALAQEWTTFIHPGYWEEFDEEGRATLRSYWEEKHPVKDMMRHKALMGGSYLFEALIQQNPVQSEDATFQEEWLKYWDWHPSKRDVIVRQASRVEIGDYVEVHLSELTIVALMDPAMGKKYSKSETAIAILGVDYLENVYLLDYYVENVSISKGIQVFQRLGRKWKPAATGCEAVLFMELILPALKEADASEIVGIYNIQGLEPEGVSKDYRIMALQPIFEQGRFFVREDQAKFHEQYISYIPGAQTKRDLLDAIAYGPRIWWRGTPIEGISHVPLSAFNKKPKITRDDVTGY